MAIRDLNNFIASIWDWQEVDDCLPGKICVSDIDGAVERKGHFLLFETKQPGARMPRGQRIMYSKFLQMNSFTLVELWGKKSNTKRLRISRNGKSLLIDPADDDDLKRIVKWWYGCADSDEFNWP